MCRASCPGRGSRHREEALSRISEALLAFASTTSFNLESNVVWLDVTGCAHLHRNESDTTGEAILASRIKAFVEKMNHACRVAVADGPRVAAAVARFGSGAVHVILVPTGESKSALSALPIDTLPIADDTIHWLSRLGMGTVGDLQQLPRRSLSLRLGASAVTVVSLLDGEDSTPLNAYIPPVVPEETATLEYGIEAIEALLFVVKGLCDRMALRLAGRAMAATRFELVLGLDRAFARAKPRSVVDLPLAAPLTEAAEMLSVLRARLDSFAIEAPILTVALRVSEMAARTATPALVRAGGQSRSGSPRSRCGALGGARHRQRGRPLARQSLAPPPTLETHSYRCAPDRCPASSCEPELTKRGSSLGRGRADTMARRAHSPWRLPGF